MPVIAFSQTPTEVLDYTLIIRRAIGIGVDPIISVFWESDGVGLVVGDGINGAPAPTVTDSSVTGWFTGGNIGTTYNVKATFTTTIGRVIVRGFTLTIVASVI